MEVVIRGATAGDAEGAVYYMKALGNEPGIYIGWEPGEFDPPVEVEMDWIVSHGKGENSLILVAVATDSAKEMWDLDDGEMVGLLDCTGGSRRAMKHETTLGISVKAGWRGQGIGRRLMEEALEWARGNEVVKRVQLEVISENVRAQKLYEELGFVAEGVRRRSIWKQGRWMDTVIMAFLK